MAKSHKVKRIDFMRLAPSKMTEDQAQRLHNITKTQMKKKLSHWRDDPSYFWAEKEETCQT